MSISSLYLTFTKSSCEREMCTTCAYQCQPTEAVIEITDEENFTVCKLKIRISTPPTSLMWPSSGCQDGKGMDVALLCIPGACHLRQVASTLLPVTL